MIAAASFAVFREGKLAAVRPAHLEGEIAWHGPKAAPCSLLLVGDSRIAQWPGSAPEGWRVGLLGYPGQGSVNVAAAAGPLIARARPSVVVIQTGINDASAAALMPAAVGDAAMSAAGAAIERLARIAVDEGARRVIVLTVVPPIAPGIVRRAVFGDRIVRHAGALSALIRARAPLEDTMVLDADALFRGDSGRLREGFRGDAVHWNGAAYRLLNNALWPMVADLPCGARRSAREGPRG